VKGKLVSSGGTVVVGEKAAVDAELQVNVAVVMGEVKGKIEAKERIEVYPPGRVDGDIQSPVISIEPGGVFNGSCAMKASVVPAGKISVLSKQPPVNSEPNDKPLTAEPKKKTAFTELKNN
jgi:cytoskeletal protein CcmA (bactofilin family)